ncbi:MAG TPA: phosphoenolpyruvate carboxykinase (ATP) [Candidatus Marinimicrobia bacterium]|nr:phosphoenolpyruvate carboxykinase (ATP) [Candidatus Neomarinimicrobiota bacterium]
MKLHLGVKSPAYKEAHTNASEFGLNNHGLKFLHRAYWNLPTPALYEEALFRSEGQMIVNGPFIVSTGTHTARAANDKLLVKEPSTEDQIWWGEYNRPFNTEKFNALLNRLQGFLQGQDVFVQDCYVGADPEYRLPIRIITEFAWHSMFVRNMFIPLETFDEMKKHIPDFTLICAPSFLGSPEIDGTNSGTFIILNLDQRLAIIGGTGYAGEIKKSFFCIMNYLMPLQGVMAMHCSANMGDDGDVAVFFGLSGTGKTTLSADPSRKLIGDDEHGWSDEGIFNFEHGCYAKVIRLSPEAEPQIHQCTEMFGTILENVIYDPVSRKLDLDDDQRTENTRCSYPLSFIDNAVVEKKGDHPLNIFMLTCDASGVLPPIARLSPDQAMYHFISGYTSKVSGTEIDLGVEPEITFSACFGAPFMVHHPYFYAKLLKEKIIKNNVDCWLVNTGWTGGPFGVGKRMSIHHTRALLNSALTGKLKDVEYRTDEVFGFQVPASCEGVPSEVLDPANTWGNKKAYDSRYRQLASQFIENFKKYMEGVPKDILKAGPIRK